MAVRGHHLAAAGICLGVLLGPCGAQYVPDTLEMKMNGKAQNVYLSANVTIPCTLYEHDSVNLNISVIGIRWFQRRSNSDKEDNVFEYNGGKQTQFRPGASISLSGLRKGNASLFLPSIQLQEAGEYRCEIIIPPIKVERTARVDVVGEREGTWSPVFHVYWMAHSWKSQPQITWKKVIPRTHSLIEDNAEYIYRTSIRNNGGHGKDYFVYMTIFMILLLFVLAEVI